MIYKLSRIKKCKCKNVNVKGMNTNLTFEVNWKLEI